MRSEARALLRLGGALCLTVCVLSVAAIVFPRLHVSETAADTLCFALGAALPIASLAIAARAESAWSLALGVALVAALALLALVWLQPTPFAGLLLVNSALLGLAWALGSSAGRRVQHPSHLLPACFVAASADLASVLSPEGPSHAIAQSERALSLLAVSFPVPGSSASAPAFGVGDLLFMALVFGVAHAQRLPYARTVGCAVLGTVIAGTAAAWFKSAVPALVPIAFVLLLGLPEIRRLRPADRRATAIAIALASSVALGCILRRLLTKN